MSEKEDGQDTTKGMSNLELLNFVKGVSDSAKEEISTVRNMYKLAAGFVAFFIAVGMYLTYKDTSEMRKAAREDIIRQEQQMKMRLDDMRDTMNRTVSNLQHYAEDQTKALENRVQKSLESGDRKIQMTVKERLDKEFNTEAIHEDIVSTAQEYTTKYAQKYITETVDSAIKPTLTTVKQLEQDTKKNTKLTDDLIQDTKKNTLLTEKNTKLTDNLIHLTDDLSQRRKLTILADEAIAKGDAKAFEELENYLNKPEKKELQSLALAEIFRVKGFYLTGTRIKGVSITHTYAAHISPNGQLKAIDAKIPTSGLIEILKKDRDWKARAKAAELLSACHEKGVPEALLMASDDNKLDVRKIALDSFSSITGFKKTDVFESAAAKNWWEKNKEEKNEKLKDQ